MVAKVNGAIKSQKRILGDGYMKILGKAMQKSARERTKKVEEVAEELFKERKELYRKLAKK